MMSMRFDTFLTDFSEVFFGLTIAEAIIIIFFVILLNREKIKGKELREEKSKLAIELKRWKDESINKNIELAECKSECQKKGQELSDLRKEQENWLKSKNASSNQSHNEHNESSNMRTDLSSEGWEHIVSKAQAKREQIIQKENDDGTIRSEVLFDSTQDKAVDIPNSNSLDSPESENKQKPAPIYRKYEYLKGLNSGKFLKIIPSPEKSYFRTWVENENRKFEFYGDVEKALANFNAIFDNVCEIIEGKQNGATQIINIDPGELDNNLKVIVKAKIKLA